MMLMLKEPFQILLTMTLLACHAAKIIPLFLTSVEQYVPSKVENGGQKSAYAGRKVTTTQEVYQLAMAV